jgi:cation transport ATPase
VAPPLADERAIGMLRRFGVFIRKRDIWSFLPDIRHIVFDKTGTLTLENPILRDSSPLERLSGPQQSVLLRISGANRHPFSRSLYETLMQRGTARSTAMADRLGVPDENAHGKLTPFEKAERLGPVGSRHTLMIGDGANDSLTFDAAGCRGTPVINRGFPEHRSDFYFLGSGIQGIRVLFAVARSRHRIVRKVFAFALAYNLTAVALCLAGQMNPLVAAVLMPISSLISPAIAGSGLKEASHSARKPIPKWGFPGIPTHRFQLADRELMC